MGLTESLGWGGATGLLPAQMGAYLAPHAMASTWGQKAPFAALGRDAQPQVGLPTTSYKHHQTEWPSRPEEWQYVMGEGAGGGGNQAAMGSSGMSESALATWFQHQSVAYTAWMRHMSQLTAPLCETGDSRPTSPFPSAPAAPSMAQHAIAMRAGAAAGASAHDGTRMQPPSTNLTASWMTPGFNPDDMAAFQVCDIGGHLRTGYRVALTRFTSYGLLHRFSLKDIWLATL
jgi:hypothetical protein